MNDVRSNGVEDGELKLREARLEFRGSEAEDSEGGLGVEMGVVGEESKVATGSRRRGAQGS